MNSQKEIPYDNYAAKNMKFNKEISQRPQKSMKIPLGNIIRQICAAQSMKLHKG